MTSGISFWKNRDNCTVKKERQREGGTKKSDKKKNVMRISACYRKSSGLRIRSLGWSVCSLSGYVFHLAFQQSGMLLWLWIRSRWSCQLWRPSISQSEHRPGWWEPLNYNLKLQRKRIWLALLLTSANPHSFNCVQIWRLGTHSNGWCRQKKESHFAINEHHQYCFSTSQVKKKKRLKHLYN